MLNINHPLKWEKYINVLEAIINQPRGNQAALIRFHPELREATLWFEFAEIQQPRVHLLLLHPLKVGQGTWLPQPADIPMAPRPKRAGAGALQTLFSWLHQHSPGTPQT